MAFSIVFAIFKCSKAKSEKNQLNHLNSTQRAELSMGTFSFILLGIIVVAAIYFISIYNNLVRIKHNVSQAWSNIDILLKQRHDELPKLVEVCKQYMQYEGSALEKIIKARASVSQAREAGNIAARREYYNDSVNINNIRIEQFPDLIVARMFNFKEQPLLEFDEEEKQDVDIKSLFN